MLAFTGSYLVLPSLNQVSIYLLNLTYLPVLSLTDLLNYFPYLLSYCQIILFYHSVEIMLGIDALRAKYLNIV